MAKKQQPSQTGIGLPTSAMLLFAVLGALVVGSSFAIIKHWPLPVSVDPYMGFGGGLWWGLVVGSLSGLVLGYLVDDKHFKDSSTEGTNPKTL